MLAHGQGGLLNAARLAAGLGISGQTVARYLDLLVDLLLVRRLAPWQPNVGKRLVKSPKVYVRDSGIVHALLGLRSQEDLLGHPVVGGSWEGFVVENLLAVAPRGTEAAFYRTSAGAEIDLVLSRGSARLAIEIKRSLTPTPSRGFHIAADDIAATRRILTYPGSETVPLDSSVRALPLEDLVRALADQGTSLDI
jgi:predicted AAA+ superfamily ATPase